MISLKHIQKKFGFHVVFNDFSLSLPDRGLFLLVGDNGCGKSTLLYLLAGLDDQYKGEYLFNGKDMKSFTENQIDNIRRKDIGLLFSHGNLFSFMNVEENRKFDLPTNNIRFVDLEESQSVNCLSGGEELLLSLSNELGKRKKIYLFDEVTSALDQGNLIKVMDILKKQSQESLIVMATHDKRIMNEAHQIKIEANN